jgi:alkylation response protein AidB-like acyl-CoA dehydrogenase
MPSARRLYYGSARPPESRTSAIDFEATEEQRLLCDSIVEFARRELNKDGVERDRRGTFSRQAWEKCASLGLLGLPVPKELGGLGADAMTIVLALEALGYGCSDNGLIFSINAQMWACVTPLTRFGSEEQKRRYLPRLADGSLIAAHGMSEPGSGSDAFSLATTAQRTGDGYVLNGSKTFVTNAPESDLFVVFATTDRDHSFGGICAFLLERDTPGLTVGRPLSKMGLRTSPMSELYLADCRASSDQVLGKPQSGMAIFNHSMRWERSCILASTVGTMRRQLERCISYAQERKQFGRPIGSFQAVSHKIVSMKLRLETSRLLVYQVAWLLDRGESATVESALTKLHLSESFLQSSLDALQIHGSYGYMTEYELERDVRDAVGGRLYSGTSEVQRNLIAGALGL